MERDEMTLVKLAWSEQLGSPALMSVVKFETTNIKRTQNDLSETIHKLTRAFQIYISSVELFMYLCAMY